MKKLDLLNLSKKIKISSKKFSFDICRITDSNLDKIVQSNLKEYINLGYYGQMKWIRDTYHKRKSPKFLWEEAKSAIVLGMNYSPKSDPLLKLSNKEKGNISVYALGEDYHRVFKGKLKQYCSHLTKILNVDDLDFKVFVDTAPLMEKPIAQNSGIGWQGKHTNLVSKKFGSWLFLGVILVNKKLAYDNKHKDNCGTCNKCIKICPTKAIRKPYQLDSRKCISYLTIEHKGNIPVKYRKKIGNRIYGCDDCLAVCPWNKFAKTSNEIKFREKNYNLDLNKLLELNDIEFRNMFAKSPIKRIGRERFLRNCCIAAGNTKNKKYIKNLDKLIDNENSKIILVASRWAKKQLIIC